MAAITGNGSIVLIGDHSTDKKSNEMATRSVWQRIWHYVFLTFFRPVYKWVSRKLTGKCELQRIMASNERGARKTLKIERSLRHSKCAALRKLLFEDRVNVGEAVQEIMEVKGISPEVDMKFKSGMGNCLRQISGYRQLLQQIETSRREPCSSDNPQHQYTLQHVWNVLCPDVELESFIGKHWKDIGFQGDDPTTDFRGMGVLAMSNLQFLTSQYAAEARELLSHSHHPQYWYSFGITSINITSLAYNLMLEGHLKTHFYNVLCRSPLIYDFHRVYCWLLADFDKFWRDEKPESIMVFNIVKAKYEKNIIKMLRGDEKASLKGPFIECHE